jgi:hypothetical protein
MSYNRSFSKHSNNLMTANDYINKKKAQTLFKVLTTNTQQPQKLLSVGGFNVSNYDLLLNFSKGSYYLSSQEKTIEVPNYTTISNTEVNINNCKKTIIKITNIINQPLTQTWNIYEGPYIVNKTNIQPICSNTLKNNPNITISNELVKTLFGKTAFANLNELDSLKDFYYPKNICFNL